MTHPDQSLSLQPAAGWQPIATAPKDGREVILAVKMRAGIKHGLLIGHYMGGGHCIEDHPPIDAGWYFWDGCMFDKASAPTHWLPMPHHPDWEPGGWEARRQPDPMIVHPVASTGTPLPLSAASPQGSATAELVEPPAEVSAKAEFNARLMRFYGVTTLQGLIDAQSKHVDRLQAKSPPTPSLRPTFPRG